MHADREERRPDARDPLHSVITSPRYARAGCQTGWPHMSGKYPSQARVCGQSARGPATSVTLALGKWAARWMRAKWAETDWARLGFPFFSFFLLFSFLSYF
jgi:hypothetical protein